MTLNQEMISEAVGRYEREMDRYIKLASRVAEICEEDIVEANAIRANVTFRAKMPRSLQGKLERFESDEDNGNGFDDVDDIFDNIDDLAGVRVSTYVEDDRQRVVDEIKKRFAGPEEQGVAIEKKDRDQAEGRKFYRATHCQVALDSDDLVGTYENLEADTCEVQVCSMLAHVWNEIEHDLAYKPSTGELSEAEKDSLEAIGHLTKSGDIAVRKLFEATEQRQKENVGRFEDVHDFVARMRDDEDVPELKELSNFANHARQLCDDLKALGVDSPEAVKEQILDGDHPLEDGYGLFDEFETWLSQNDPNSVSLDRDSSDILLVLLLKDRVQDVLDLHPMGRGRGRPPRIASIATRFKRMREEQEQSE